MTDPLEINPEHDPTMLRQQLEKHGRLQVTEFLKPQSAEFLYQNLLDNQSWFLAYNDGDNFYETPLHQIQQAAEPDRQRMLNNIYQRAGQQFQYLFVQYAISQAIELEEDKGHPMHNFHELMNRPKTLQFMRELTGDGGIVRADTYASCYAPGHFLNQHDDKHQTHDRVAAYVLSMTRDWQCDWGGQLVFYDESGNISQGYLPTYNCLNIFLVPQPHAVQPVASFARANRTAYLGWLHRK